jgi:hypothetical protein
MTTSTSLCLVVRLQIALSAHDHGAHRGFVQPGFNDIPHLAAGLT